MFNKNIYAKFCTTFHIIPNDLILGIVIKIKSYMKTLSKILNFKYIHETLEIWSKQIPIHS